MSIDRLAAKKDFAIFFIVFHENMVSDKVTFKDGQFF